MKKFIILFSACVINSNLFAGGFDDLGNSARVVSMGGANIAVADAPYSIFYNPAGIHRIKNLSLSSTYSNLYPGIEDDNINYISLSAVVPWEIIGEFGIGGSFLNSDLWQENTFIFSYARKVYENLAIGGSLKLLRWSAEAAPGESALSYFGFTFDAGAHYTFSNLLDNSDLQVGISVQNITQPSIANNGSADANLPMSLGLGFAFVSNIYNYIIALDIVKYDNTTKIKTGAEFLGLRHEVLGLNTSFLLRVGYDGIIGSDLYSQRGINGGFGLYINDIRIDYAYVFPLVLQNVGGSHKISLNYNFNF
ncbi:MAG: type IX secretion system membrane protein PorP/SprF [Ignavibacteriaceae bacterium]|nr:type IX secretion system membrane protein PorP/SprF [Ignavibacteriaceae bacterium]